MVIIFLAMILAFLLYALYVRRAGMAMRESEEKFRNLFRNSREGIGIIKENVFTEANASLCRMLGAESLESLNAQPLSQMMVRELTERMHQQNGGLLRSSRHEWKIFSKGLAEVDLEIFSSQMMQGTNTCIFVNFHDISEKMQPERKLHSLHYSLENGINERTLELYTTNVELTEEISRRKKIEDELRLFKTIAERANFGVIITNENGIITYVNEYFASVHGYFPQDIIGRSRDIFHTEAQIEGLRAIRTELIENGSFHTREIWHWHRDGFIFPMLMSGVTIRDESENILFFAATALDISERKKAEEELNKSIATMHHAQRLAATGRLAASVAHEINNPLQALYSNLGFVEQALPTKFTEWRSIRQLKTGMNRIRNTVRQLLDLHRSKAGTGESIDVHAVLASTLELMENQMSIRKIRTSRRFCEGNPRIMGFSQDLHHVFMNLILNAQETMQDGGELHIETGVDTERMTIEIADNGCGMSEEELGHIFEPLHTTESNTLSTGLGLSTVKDIIDHYGGEIKARSNPGSGSTFLITLPVMSQ